MRLFPRLKNRQALRIDRVRKWVGHSRLMAARLGRRVQTLDSEKSAKETLQHNLKSLGDFSNRRIELLILPLSVIETTRDAKSVLIIGPRNENDLLIASTYLNLPMRDIRGLDLISYSRQIDLGDMHQMPYEDNSFDIVICGWTLSYSGRPDVLAQEMVRVCRTGGTIAIGVEYSNMDEAGYEQLLGYSLAIPGLERVNSVEAIHDLFGDVIDQHFFSHDAPLRLSHRAEGKVMNPSNVASIFSIDKCAVAHCDVHARQIVQDGSIA